MDSLLQPAEGVQPCCHPDSRLVSRTERIIAVDLSNPVRGNLLMQMQETNRKTKVIFLFYLSMVL